MNLISCKACGVTLWENGAPKMATDIQIERDFNPWSPAFEVIVMRCGHCGEETGIDRESLYSEPQKEPEPKFDPDRPAESEALMCIRQWDITQDGTLMSTGIGGVVWEPGKDMVAECKKPPPVRYSLAGYYEYAEKLRHAVPEEDCDCGLYAFRDLEAAKRSGDGLGPHRIRGVVSAWGEVIECSHGVRAEKMRIEALLLENQTERLYGSPVSVVAAQRRLAEKYGVPLILPSELKSFAGEKNLVVLEKPEEEDPKGHKSGTYHFGGYASQAVTSRYIAGNSIGSLTWGHLRAGPPEDENLSGFARWKKSIMRKMKGE